MKNKTQLLQALSKFIAQRSGIEYANYGERNAFMGDYRPILRAGRDARQLLRFVELRDSITAEMLMEATRAYSGRLQFVEAGENMRVDYTTGQYFPTEYRNAACAVLASAIWAWLRDNMPVNEICNAPQTHQPGIVNAGEYIRKAARRELGRGIASRWFN